MKSDIRPRCVCDHSLRGAVVVSQNPMRKFHDHLMETSKSRMTWGKIGPPPSVPSYQLHSTIKLLSLSYVWYFPLTELDFTQVDP